MSYNIYNDTVLSSVGRRTCVVRDVYYASTGRVARDQLADDHDDGDGDGSVCRSRRTGVYASTRGPRPRLPCGFTLLGVRLNEKLTVSPSSRAFCFAPRAPTPSPLFVARQMRSSDPRAPIPHRNAATALRLDSVRMRMGGFMRVCVCINCTFSRSPPRNVSEPNTYYFLTRCLRYCYGFGSTRNILVLQTGILDSDIYQYIYI